MSLYNNNLRKLSLLKYFRKIEVHKSITMYDEGKYNFSLETIAKELPSYDTRE